MAFGKTGAALARHADLGLLVIRLGVGLSLLLFHGWGKITGGPERWERTGREMANLGIRFYPVFWGLMAALAESLGAVLLMLGLFFRPSAGVIAFAPFWLDITDALTAGGPNEVVVSVFGTLKNTLGPFHNKPALGRAWPGGFQQGAKGGRPAGKDYSVVDYGLFEDFKIKMRTE